MSISVNPTPRVPNTTLITKPSVPSFFSPPKPDRFERGQTATAMRFGHAQPPVASDPQTRHFALSVRVLDDEIDTSFKAADWDRMFDGLDLTRPVEVPMGNPPPALSGVGSLGTITDVHAPSLLAALWIQAASTKNTELEESLLNYAAKGLAKSDKQLAEALGRIGFNPTTAPMPAKTRDVWVDIIEHPSMKIREAFSRGLAMNALLQQNTTLQSLAVCLLDEGKVEPLRGLAQGVGKNLSLHQSPYAQQLIEQLEGYDEDDDPVLQTQLHQSMAEHPNLQQTPFARNRVSYLLERLEDTELHAEHYGDVFMGMVEGLSHNPSLPNSPFIQDALRRLAQNPSANIRSRVAKGIGDNAGLVESSEAQTIVDQLSVDAEMLVRSHLAGSLGRNLDLDRGTFIRPIITRLAQDPEDLVRRHMARGLAANPRLQGSAFAQHTLQGLFAEGNSSIRQGIAEGLGENPCLEQSPFARQLLDQTLQAPSTGAWLSLYTGLYANKGPTNTPYIRDLVKQCGVNSAES